jgi:hypothetical protein
LIKSFRVRNTQQIRKLFEISHDISRHEKTQYVLRIVNLIYEHLNPVAFRCLNFEYEIIYCRLQLLNQLIGKLVLSIIETYKYKSFFLSINNYSNWNAMILKVSFHLNMVIFITKYANAVRHYNRITYRMSNFDIRSDSFIMKSKLLQPSFNN